MITVDKQSENQTNAARPVILARLFDRSHAQGGSAFMKGTVMKHTKDDWIVAGMVRDQKDPIFYHVDIICGGKRVARSSGIGEKEAYANAKLIAAAPKLLVACEIALLALTHEPINPDDIEFIKVAIADAT